MTALWGLRCDFTAEQEWGVVFLCVGDGWVSDCEGKRLEAKEMFICSRLRSLCDLWPGEFRLPQAQPRPDM